MNTKKPLLWLVILGLLAGGAYWVWRISSSKTTSGTSASVPADKAPARPRTAVVAERDIHFAITAAGDIGPLDAVSVRPEIGGADLQAHTGHWGQGQERGHPLRTG